MKRFFAGVMLCILMLGAAFNGGAQVVSASSLVVADSAACAVRLDTLGAFSLPVEGRVISHYGMRRRRFHAGTDIKLALGDSVRSAFGGVVIRSARVSGYGLLVVLSHGCGVDTYYAHLNKLLVGVGDTVPSGHVIGLGGRTGRATTTHLHFEIRVDKRHVNPERVIDFEAKLLLADCLPLPTPASELISPFTVTGPGGNGRYHVIVKNDTLYSLAKRYGTSVKVLCELNGLTSSSVLRIGQRIRL